MHAFWAKPTQVQATAVEIRDDLARSGRDLAYTTVATLVRILCEKQFLEQTNGERPFTYRPIRSFKEVSGSLVSDLVERLFGGRSEQLLLRLFEERKLTSEERAVLKDILRDTKKEGR